jgi:hypothetical protein
MATAMNQICRQFRFIFALFLIGLAGCGNPQVSSDQRSPAERATLTIQALDATDRPITSCQAIMVDPAGYLLTAFACVAAANGELYHPEGLVAVAAIERPGDAPRLAYLAQFVSGSPKNQLAILRISQMLRPDQQLPDPLPLAAVTFETTNVVADSTVIIVSTVAALTAQLLLVRDLDGDGVNDLAELDRPIATLGTPLATNAGQLAGIVVDTTPSGNALIRLLPNGATLLREAQIASGTGLDDTGARPIDSQNANVSVQLRGQVVAQATGQPVAGALVLALLPNTASEALQPGETLEASVAAQATTNQDGQFVLVLPAPIQNVYGLAVSGERWQTRVFPNRIIVGREPPATIDLDVITLERAEQ